MTTILEKPANETQSSTKVDFGNGRYSSEMERIYKGCIERFGIESAKAEKIAKQAGSDAGAAFRNATASIKIGKGNKDGKVTIADASKAKGITLTNPLAIVRALQWISDAGVNHVSYGFSKFRLTDELEKWIDDLKV